MELFFVFLISGSPAKLLLLRNTHMCVRLNTIKCIKSFHRRGQIARFDFIYVIESSEHTFKQLMESNWLQT